MDQIGLKNRSEELDAHFTTLNGLLFLDLKCDFQYNMAINFFDSIVNDLEFLVSNELERVKFTKFFNYFRNNYLNKNHKFFLGKISNFSEELTGNWSPQLSNNVLESFNSVLNNIYKRSFINKATCVEGIHKFYSDRRDKFRVYLDGNKANKRKLSDLKRFENLKFISQSFLAIISNPLNYFYPQFLSAAFFETIFKFARVEDPNINEKFSFNFSNQNYQPQINIP